MLGYSPRELENSNCLDLIHPNDVSVLKKTLEEALFFREGRTAELRFRHVNGSWVFFESAGSFIFDQTGRPQRALIVSRDTSDRKRAEGALAASEERFRQFAENSSDVMRTSSHAGRSLAPRDS